MGSEHSFSIISGWVGLEAFTSKHRSFTPTSWRPDGPGEETGRREGRRRRWIGSEFHELGRCKRSIISSSEASKLLDLELFEIVWQLLQSFACRWCQQAHRPVNISAGCPGEWNTPFSAQTALLSGQRLLRRPRQHLAGDHGALPALLGALDRFYGATAGEREFGGRHIYPMLLLMEGGPFWLYPVVGGEDEAWRVGLVGGECSALGKDLQHETQNHAEQQCVMFKWIYCPFCILPWGPKCIFPCSNMPVSIQSLIFMSSRRES